MTNRANALQTSDESLTLRLIEIVRRRRTLALFCFGTVLAATLSFALCLPDLYRATAGVLVERQIPESFVRPAVTGELESRLHVIKQEILSRDKLTQLVDRFNLYADLRSRMSQEEILERTRHDIAVDPSGPEQVSGRIKTVTFRLSYTSRDRDTVAGVTNAITAFYVAQNDRIRSQEAAQTTQFLKTQLEEARKQLRRHEDNVRAYTSRHIGELPQQVEVNLAALERLNTQLRLNGERQLKALDQRERLVDMQRPVTSGATAARLVETDPAIARLEEKRETLAQMETRFTSKHPDVLRLKEEIAVLDREVTEQKLAQQRARAQQPASDQKPAEGSGSEAPVADPAAMQLMRRNTIEAIDAELDKLKQEENGLRQMIATVEKRLESVPERQQDFALLTRDHNAAKELYESLLKRYDEAQLAESMETDRQGERFRVLETALPPEGPTAPNRPRLMFMGVFLAIALSLLVVLAVEQFDSTFHSVDDIRRFTKVPVLVTIPYIVHGSWRRYLRPAMVAVSFLLVLGLVISVSTHFARGNEDLVRLLVRGA
ncbi:MAG: hypothetical protein HY654_08220 [Acidobacteria bacterium]|nr:hypothetical protein [Acidobacteriota bacterium]